MAHPSAPPPTASSLLPSSIIDSIKTYLMSIDVAEIGEYEKEFRKTEKQNPDLMYSAIPYPSQMQSVETTDNESNCEDDEDVLPTPRHKQNSGYSAASDESEIVLFEKKGMKQGKQRRRRQSCGTIIEKRTAMVKVAKKKKEDSTPKTVYNVSDNENLNTIALKFNISPNMLKQINALTTSIIFPGQSLIVPIQKVQKEVIEAVLQPMNDKEKVEEKKKNQFYKYDMKRITRFDGAVTGTTLLTTNVFMFRSCVTEPLVIRNSQQRYDVTIPLDSFAEILMFDSFDSMLSTVETNEIVNGTEVCPKCEMMKNRIHRDSATSANSCLSDEQMREGTPIPIMEEEIIDSIVNDTDEGEICDFDVAYKGLEDTLEQEQSLDAMSYEDTPRISVSFNSSAASSGQSSLEIASNDKTRIAKSGSFAGSLCSSGSERCQHEFQEFFSETSSARYSVQNRINPFNQNHKQPTSINIALPEPTGPSSLGCNSFEQSTMTMSRGASDPNLATAEFLKKIDDQTTSTNASISRPMNRKFPYFILLQGVLCARTYGQPSYYRLHQEKHKLVQFWFSMMEADISDFIGNISSMCSQLEDVKDKSNCLLRCSGDHFDKIHDAILPDEAPKYEPRAVDSTLLSESFSASLIYKDSISVMLSTEFMEQLQPYLPCHIIGMDMHLAYSLRAHGMSLKSMYLKCQRYSEYPALFLVKDTQGYLFGAYMSDGVKESVRYYGTGETFLFRLKPEVDVYPWQGNNDYFMMGCSDYFTIGAGNGQFALYVSEMLDKGTSNRSETFYNDILGSTSEFNILDVEVWSFADETIVETSESSDSSRGGNLGHFYFSDNFNTKRASVF